LMIRSELYMHVIPAILMPEIFADGPHVAIGLKPWVGSPDIGISHSEFFPGDHPGQLPVISLDHCFIESAQFVIFLPAGTLPLSAGYSGSGLKIPHLQCRWDNCPYQRIAARAVNVCCNCFSSFLQGITMERKLEFIVVDCIYNPAKSDM